MKRTLTFSLFLALTAGAVAQQPAVVQVPAANSNPAPAKPAAKPATVSVKPAAVKPSPVKPGAKTPAAVKPAVVAVQPAPGKAVALTPVKTAAVPTVKPATNSNVKAATVKPVSAPKAAPVVSVAAHSATSHPTAVAAAPVSVGHGPVAVKANTPAAKAVSVTANAKDPFKKEGSKPAVVQAQPVVAKAGATVSVNDNKPVAENKKPEAKKIDAAGRRDPFISPVVAMGAVGSGCSTGKRCLAIDQIALRGVVKSDNGMIAVVVNAMEKAYFLRENDPVFDGYVEKITGDSIVFKETFHDKLGKSLTRDVTKTISRPVA